MNRTQTPGVIGQSWSVPGHKKVISTTDLLTLSGAIFSEDELHRFVLWRVWDEQPSLVVIGLNPSTADHKVNDPTIRRCIGYARDWGHGGLVMLNLFSLRSTDPTELWKRYAFNRRDQATGDPANEQYLHRYTEPQVGQRVLCAWGDHGRLGGRGRVVAQRLAGRVDLMALGTTKRGHPSHPLYLPKSRRPRPFSPEEIA